MAKKVAGFEGFPKGTLKFFKDLSKNNSKAWFDEHRDDYEKLVKEPSAAFCVTMGERLRKIAPQIVAEPKVNRSLFRINRDTRFSNDKTPYKTNLGILWWTAPAKRFDSGEFYFHIDPVAGTMFVAGGMHQIPQDMLDEFRRSVLDDALGKALVKAVEKVTKAGDYKIWGEHYKTVPRGFDKDHPRADWLKYTGVIGIYETKIVPELYTPEIVDWTFEHFKKFKPLYDWTQAMADRHQAGF
ncbi:DUF2461 domain-containing protein [bacterium]|nr:DUF2461 domain-containing protein [bacterium]